MFVLKRYCPVACLCILAGLIDSQFIAFNRILLEGVVDIGSIRISWQAILGISPGAAILFLNADCLYKLAVRKQFNIDMIRTKPILIVYIIPLLRDSNVDFLRHILVRQVRNSSFSNRILCFVDTKYGFILNPDVIVIFHRKSGCQCCPVILLTQCILCRDIIPVSILQLAVIERYRFSVDQLHQGNLQFFRSEPCAVVVIFPYL